MNRKTKLLTLASLLAITSFGIVGCSNASGNATSEVSSLGIQIKTFSVDDIADCLYGSEINFQQYVHITTTSATAIVEFKVESLTPETLTIDQDKPNVGIVTGAGECKARISALDQEKIVSFNAYATVSSIKVKQAPSEILEGDSLNLDDYISVNTASPSGSSGAYFAKSKTPDIATIGSDGKTVSFVGSGTFLIEIKDFSQKKTAYFTGKVISKLQKQVQVFASNIKTNYTVYSMDGNTNDITSFFPTYHTENYFAYPYGFQLTNWGEEGEVYWGMFKFPDGNVYEYTSSYFEENGLPDSSSIKVGSLQRDDVANIFGFQDFDYSIFDEFESHKTDGEEDYLVADYSSSLADVLFGDVLGLSIPSNYCDTFGATIKKYNGKDALYIYCFSKGTLVNQFCISDVGTTSYLPFDTFVSDIKNEKDKILTTEIQNVIKNIITKGNYTVTSKTYIANDETGVPYTFDEAIAIYAPLHTLYYEGVAKYTQTAMMINNTELFQGFEGLQDKTKAEGYIEDNNAIYSVSYDSDNKVFVKDSTPITDTKGENYSNYEDYFDTLAAVNFDTFDQFIVLDYDEQTKTYTFSIGKNSKEGSDNLRALTNFVNPEMSTNMFPTNSYGNEFEAGYAGQGTITLNEDGGYTFTYYTSRISSTTTGGSIEFRICMEYTVSNVGTTTIEEYQGL